MRFIQSTKTTSGILQLPKKKIQPEVEDQDGTDQNNGYKTIHLKSEKKKWNHLIVIDDLTVSWAFGQTTTQYTWKFFFK